MYIIWYKSKDIEYISRYMSYIGLSIGYLNIMVCDMLYLKISLVCVLNFNCCCFSFFYPHIIVTVLFFCKLRLFWLSGMQIFFHLFHWYFQFLGLLFGAWRISNFYEISRRNWKKHTCATGAQDTLLSQKKILGLDKILNLRGKRKCMLSSTVTVLLQNFSTLLVSCSLVKPC